MWLFIIFLSVPLIEIALFIQIGGFLGLWPTLGIVILTAVIGTWLVRQQGAMAIGQLRNNLSRMDDPSEPLAHGAMILFSGALLLTPGFFTDAVGFALLIPGVRVVLMQQIRKRVHVHRFDMGTSHPQEPHQPPIDGEYFKMDVKISDQPGNSGWRNIE